MSLKLREPITPTKDESRQAQETVRLLAPHLESGRELRLQIVEGDRPPQTLAIPATVVRMLAGLLAEVADGNAVTLLRVNAELTTQQAADFLSASRAFVIAQMEKGEIPYRKVGTHRRVRFRDLLEYKRRIDAARRETLNELAALDQQLGLDD